jgi:endoribonuclease LACTB2
MDPIPAASLLAYTPEGRVLAGGRRIEIPFLGGFTVFPGGRIEPEDRERAREIFGSDDDSAIAKTAALRELREEMGLTFDGKKLVRAIEGAPLAPKLDPAAFTEAPRWVTPDVIPIRFDTRFFCLLVEETAEPSPSDDELEWAAPLTPRELLDKWQRLEILLAGPTLMVLEAIAGGFDRPADRIATELAKRRPLEHFESVAGIRQLPLLTPTLPPARHTNAYLVGKERIVVVDPATYEDDERKKLLEEVAALEAEGGRLVAVVLTHHHQDHVGSARWLADTRRVPVLAHPITKELLADRIAVDRTIVEGERIDLGKDATSTRFELEVLFTPGHAPGHVVLKDLRPGSGALIVGDMIAGLGTIVIDPPEGDMGEYLRQLTRLRDLDPRIIFPAHGPAIAAARQKLDQYIAHRLMREAKVAGALAKAQRGTARELVPDAYDDTPPELYWLAERSCLAHLLKLVEDGRAARDGEHFSVSR